MTNGERFYTLRRSGASWSDVAAASGLRVSADAARAAARRFADTSGSPWPVIDDQRDRLDAVQLHAIAHRVQMRDLPPHADRWRIHSAFCLHALADEVDPLAEHDGML